MTIAEQIDQFAKGVAQLPPDMGLPTRPADHTAGCFCETCRKYDTYRTVLSLLHRWEGARNQKDIPIVDTAEYTDK